MTGLPRSGPSARPRRAWRWCWRGLLGLFACLCFGVVYLTLIGFPDFLKRPILRQARLHGIEMEVDRLRLDYYRGLVAESVVVSGAGLSRGPELDFAEVTFRPTLGALWRFSLRTADLELTGGRVALALDDVEESGHRFTADSMSAELRWLPGDRLEISRLTARALGVRLELSGSLTNASRLAFRGSPAVDATPASALETWRVHLDRVLRLAETLRFSREPEVHLEVSGDAADLTALTVRIRLQADDAVTPWGDLAELRVQGWLNQPAGTDDLGASRVTFDFSGFQTPWSGVEEGRLELGWIQSFTNPIPTQVDWNLDLKRIRSPWGTSPGLRVTLHAEPDSDPMNPLVGELVLTSDSLLGGFAQAETNRLTAQVTLDPHTFLPNRADWQLRAGHVTFPRGSARELRLGGQLTHRTDRPAVDTRDWAWWSWLEPFALDWSGAVEELVIDEIASDRVEMAGSWLAPSLELGELRGELLGSAIECHGRMDVDSGEVEASTRLELALPLLEGLLPSSLDGWLQALRWPEPLAVEASFGMVWPGWALDRIDWGGEWLPTLRVEGGLQGRRIAYRDLAVEELRARFSFFDGVGSVSDFVIRRPEGSLELSYREVLASRDFHLTLRSGVDPHAFESLLDLKHDRIVDLFHFRAPPQIDGELWGCWDDLARFGARGTIQASRFSIREEDIDAFAATVSVTNAFLQAVDVEVQVGDEWVAAPSVGFDFGSRWLSFTNVTTHLHPQRVGRAIGPKTSRNLSPYEFDQPPRARVEGGVNVTDIRYADLRFEVAGGPFRYWRFQVPEVSGHVHWLNERLDITNLRASFYQGTLDGDIHVDIPRNQDNRVRLQTRVNRADLNQLMGDLFMPTKRLEGVLNLNLTITDAVANDAQTWQGFGRADLRDGFLWDIPLFGLVSPVLDSVVPGLGRSRINGATATFNVTNSIVHTGDLELRAPFFRLAYRGAVDLNGRVNARVEARLLRDAWVVGPLVSLIFSPLTKLFESQVTGTIAEPEMELLYIPKPLQLPLDPIGTIRDMIQDDRPPPPPP
jgi:hypothetical protein